MFVLPSCHSPGVGWWKAGTRCSSRPNPYICRGWGSRTAKVDSEPFDGCPLWNQAATAGQWQWSLGWEHEDAPKAHYKSRWAAAR